MSLVEHVENSAERDLGAFFLEEITSCTWTKAMFKGVSMCLENELATVE